LRDGHLGGSDGGVVDEVAGHEGGDDVAGLDVVVGLVHEGFVTVGVELFAGLDFEAFEAEVTGYAEVMECSVVTGQSSDYLLKAVVPDMEYYEKFLLGKLTRIPGVAGVHSSFELRRVVQRTELPLEHISDKTVL